MRGKTKAGWRLWRPSGTRSGSAWRPPWKLFPQHNQRPDKEIAVARTEGKVFGAPAEASKDALIVGAADKLHNARAILNDYRQVGEELWSRFSVPKAEQLWYYGALVEAFKQTTAPNALVDELQRIVNELTAECE
jgi:hypothetical protein